RTAIISINILRNNNDDSHLLITLNLYKVMYYNPMRQRSKHCCLHVSKIIITMKLTIAIILIATLQTLAFNGLAQSVNLKLRNASIEEALSALRKQTGYHFVYPEGVLD